MFGFAVDVTERAELERRTAEAHQRERTLRQIVEAALPQRDLDALLTGLVERVAATFEADRAVLLLLEDGVLRVRASHNVDPADAAEVHVPLGRRVRGPGGRHPPAVGGRRPVPDRRGQQLPVPGGRLDRRRAPDRRRAR